MTSLTYPAQASLTGSRETLTYRYDAAWRPTRLSSSFGGNYISSAGYTALDQPANETFGNGAVQTWGYDERDRLTSWQTTTGVTQSYTYNAIGNLISKAGAVYIYGATNAGPHAARNANGLVYQYDANGNMTGSAASRTFT